jgi:alkyl hydroperoxide reductase subunit F
LFKGKRVAVIGGGNSGVEAAIDLAGIVAHVTLLEFDTFLRADAVLQSKLYSLPNVNVITPRADHRSDRRRREGERPRLQGSDSNEMHTIELEGIFVQIGLLPNTDWLKGTLNLSPRGEIEVDRADRRRCPAFSPPATARRCRTSRSSSPWAKAPRPRSAPSIT